MQKEFDVFISYSRKDYVDEQKNVIPGNEVSKVKDALTKAGITYWFDEEGIYSGENFVEKIVTFLIYYVYDSEQTENNAFRSYNTIECDSSKIALNDLTLEKANQFFENEQYKKAFYVYSIFAVQGNPTAQYIIGVCYDNGQGIEQDVTQAVNWYCKAAEQGHEWAIKRLKELDEYKDAIEVADTILP